MKAQERQIRTAFAICAHGERFESYRDNLIRSLKAYVKDPEIVLMDIDKAESLLPSVSNKRRSIQMTRMAIPLMEEFAQYDRVIWLDADTEVNSGKFSGIMSVETSDDGLAAIEDIYQDMYKRRMQERYDDYDKEHYCNSGVLVMDLCKIDKESWKRKVHEAIEEHERDPFKSPDQDILNRYFDIRCIDKRYNWIWRRGVDANKGAWLIHYTDNEGHKILDEIIGSRKKDSIRGCEKTGRRVVVDVRNGSVIPWIRSYFGNGNTIPLIAIRSSASSWSEEEEEFCRKACEFCGGDILDVDSGLSRNKIMSEVAKKFAPSSWAWISGASEVTGNIDECFDYAERHPGFILSRFFFKNDMIPESIDNRHPVPYWKSEEDVHKICCTSFMIFHGEANERMSDLDRFSSRDQDDAFGLLYESDDVWHEGFCDLSMMGWHVNCKTIADIPEGWGGKVISFMPEDGKSLPEDVIETIMSDRTIVAQFEKDDSLVDRDHEDENAVDAVFVIGTGSNNDNEELRYALRNIEKNCKFVRDVYICGECPSWVDRTAVRHLRWPDRFSHAKDANIIDKLRHACEHRGIAKNILFCSDDQFQTKECKWEDFRPRYLRRYASNDKWYAERKRVWHTRLRNTLEREVSRRISLGMDAGKVYYYQPHIWMAMDRDLFIKYAKWSNYESRTDTIIASGYYNFIDADGVPDFDHAFMGNNESKMPSERHVAYHDGSYKAAMAVLKNLFPEKSRFEASTETSGRKKAQMPAVSKTRTYSSRSTSPVKKEKYDASRASQEEMDEIKDISKNVSGNPMFSSLLGEISRAEEMRLFGVKGWREVWSDIARRFREAEAKRIESEKIIGSRSEEASRIVRRYMSDPESMRTVRFGKAGHDTARHPSRRQPMSANASLMSDVRSKIRNSLLNRFKH